MLQRSNYVIVVLLIALLAWSVATDIAALLLTALEPAALAPIAGQLGGSQTAAIVGVAGCMVFFPLIVALAWRRDTIDRSAAFEGFDVVWEDFAKTFQSVRSARPDAAYVHSAASNPTPGLIAGRVLSLREDIAAGLRMDRTRRPESYDFASFVLLHELGHARSGDARLFGVREILAATLAALLTLSIVIWTSTPTNPLFPFKAWGAAIVLAGTLAAILRQINREIEKAADAWALDQIVAAHGSKAGAAVVARFDKLRPGKPTIGLPEVLAAHPTLARRRAALRMRVHLWPLTLLWMAGILVLNYTQIYRMDPTCNDCDPYYQAWFDVLAVAIVGLLTVVVLSILVKQTPGVWDRRIWRRIGAVGLAALSYVAARAWLRWDALLGWINDNGALIAIKGLILSTDLYTWLVVGHLVVAAVVASWLTRDFVNRREGVPPHPQANAPAGRVSVAGRVIAWLRAGFPAGVFRVGRVVSLTWAILLFSTFIGMTVHAATAGMPTSHMLGLAPITVCGLISLAAYRMPSTAIFWIEGVSVSVALGSWVFLIHLLSIAMVQSGLDPVNPEAQVIGGQVLKDHVDVLFAIDGAPWRAFSGSIIELIAGTVIILALTMLRVKGSHIVRSVDEPAGLLRP